jgi:hypothetical protein
MEQEMKRVSKKEPFAKQAALFCLLAPMVAIAMNVAAMKAVQDYAMGSMVIGGVSALFMLASPVFGVIALAGIRRHGTRGILVRSIIGIGLSTVCIASGVFVFLLASRGALPSPDDFTLRERLIGTWERRGRAPAGETVSWMRLSTDGTFRRLTTGGSVANFSGTWSVQNKRIYLLVNEFVEGNRAAIGNKIVMSIDQITSEKLVVGGSKDQAIYARLRSADGETLADLERKYQIAQTGMSTYATWIGQAKVSGCVIVSNSHDDRASFAAQFRSYFGKPTSLLQLVIDNSAGSGAIVIDPASAKLYSGEQLVAAALPPKQILATAKKDKASWLGKYSGNITVARGRKCLNRMVFLPLGTNMSQVTHVTIQVNGAPTSIPGRLLSAEELMDAYRKGKEMQRAQQKSKTQK